MSRRIGQYEIERELGQGGMGTVYLGLDPRLGREVAIKVLKPKLYMEDPGFSARFEREAKTVASLTHNCIVPIYEYGDDGEWRYFVMPYMNGGTLRERLENGPLSLKEALPILQRVSAGLDKAHKNGIVHRDLKPANILFDGDGEAYLSDFGIVKLADPTGKGTIQMTSTGVALGTPHYMSPEQLDGLENLDGRSDIYALGIILYEMLTGKKPYDHESMPRIIAMHYSYPIPNILEANPNLPPGIADVIRTAMAKKREERYETSITLYTKVQETVTEQIGTDTRPQMKLKPEPAAAKKTLAAEEKKPAAAPPVGQPDQKGDRKITQPVSEAGNGVSQPKQARGKLSWSRAFGWIFVSVFGFGVGLVVVFITASVDSGDVLEGGLFGITSAIVEWLFLRRYTRHSVYWILLKTIGFIACYPSGIALISIVLSPIIGFVWLYRFPKLQTLEQN